MVGLQHKRPPDACSADQNPDRIRRWTNRPAVRPGLSCRPAVRPRVADCVLDERHIETTLGRIGRGKSDTSVDEDASKSKLCDTGSLQLGLEACSQESTVGGLRYLNGSLRQSVTVDQPSILSTLDKAWVVVFMHQSTSIGLMDRLHIENREFTFDYLCNRVDVRD